MLTSYETATRWSVDKVESWRFIQDAAKEALDALAKRIIGSSYATNKVYVLYGCVATGTDPGARTVSAGAVFYNGEVYLVDAASFTTSGNVAIATIADTADPTADPTLFNDNSTEDIHRVRKVLIAAGTSGTGIANLSDFIQAAKVAFTHLSGTQSTASGSYVDLTGSTFTTPNDGITRNYLILAKTRVHYTNSTGDGGVIRLYNSSSSTELDMNEQYRKAQVPGPADVTFTEVASGVSCMYYGAIGPNVTVKVQVKSSNGAGSIDFTNNSFIMIEQ